MRLLVVILILILVGSIAGQVRAPQEIWYAGSYKADSTALMMVDASDDGVITITVTSEQWELLLDIIDPCRVEHKFNLHTNAIDRRCTRCYAMKPKE